MDETKSIDRESDFDRMWREACTAVPDPTLGLSIAPLPGDTSYRSYLQSDIWRRTRALALEYYGNKCCLCNSANNLNVHHRTYERKGNERLADLIVLCRDCHAKYHGKAA